MKNEGMNKHTSRWTALLAMVLCMALCASLATGCAAGSAEARTDPKPVSGTEENETAAPAEIDAPADMGKVLPIRIKPHDNGTAFQLEDAGATPGLDMMLSLPFAWLDRYEYSINDTGLCVYCKATREEEPEMGWLFFIECRKGADVQMDVPTRTLAITEEYTVLMVFPSDVQSTPATEEEFMTLRREAENVKLVAWNWACVFTEEELSSEYVIIADTYDIFLHGMPHRCDEETSRMLKAILTNRPYEAPLIDGEFDENSAVALLSGDTLYLADLRSGTVMRASDRAVAALKLDDMSRARIRETLENGGTLRGEEMLEAMSAANAHFEREAADGMLDGHRVTFVKHIVSPDPDATTLCRERGDIGGSDWAFFLTVIFVPENPEDIQYYMAGNTHEYIGDDPDVPEGAYEYTRVGCVARDVNAWHVEITGTGW